jgi:hypothetical protein
MERFLNFENILAADRAETATLAIGATGISHLFLICGSQSRTPGIVAGSVQLEESLDDGRDRRIRSNGLGSFSCGCQRYIDGDDDIVGVGDDDLPLSPQVFDGIGTVLTTNGAFIDGLSIDAKLRQLGSSQVDLESAAGTRSFGHRDERFPRLVRYRDDAIDVGFLGQSDERIEDGAPPANPNSEGQLGSCRIPDREVAGTPSIRGESPGILENIDRPGLRSPDAVGLPFQHERGTFYGLFGRFKPRGSHGFSLEIFVDEEGLPESSGPAGVGVLHLFPVIVILGI